MSVFAPNESLATKMKKTPCDSIFSEESNFEARMINAIVNCLALEHRRFNDALMALGAVSASLAADPLNSEIYERTTQAWARLKSDLWSHLALENGLVFWWSGYQVKSGRDFVGDLSREQREIREVVRRIEFGTRKESEGAASQARAFVAIADLLDKHIEHYEADVFLAIRGAVSQPVEDAHRDRH